MIIQDKYQHSLEFDNEGFIIVKPIDNLKCLINWSKIESIVFSPNRTGVDSAEWIFYLNTPPVYRQESNAWWLGKITFFLTYKKGKKLRIRDDFNKDFYFLPMIIEENLSKISNLKESIFIKNYEKKQSTEIPWTVLYDRYGRTVEEIYKRDNGI